MRENFSARYISSELEGVFSGLVRRDISGFYSP